MKVESKSGPTPLNATPRKSLSVLRIPSLKKYDETIVFTDLYTAVKLNGWESDQASGAELSVNNFDNLDMVESRVISKVKGTVDHYGETYSSATIKELNPQIFQWLDLMDLNVWIILALMLIVAGVTMISGLLIIILERTSMIGILKAFCHQHEDADEECCHIERHDIQGIDLYGNGAHIIGLCVQLDDAEGLLKR
mgnify:CR=1 FL=1